MRRATAFLHLSRYEGNSIVCNEAMAMNLPCLFTRVGLMLDPDQQLDVQLLEPQLAFNDPAALLERTRAFLSSLSSRSYRPRQWVTEHASIDATRAAWSRALTHFDRSSWGAR